MRKRIEAQAKYTPYEEKNEMYMNFKEFLTITDLASMCGVTRRTLYSWMKQRGMPRHEVMSDGRIYFYPDEAKAFAEENRK